MSSIGAQTINPPEVTARPQRSRVVIHAFTSGRIRTAPDPLVRGGPRVLDATGVSDTVPGVAGSRERRSPGHQRQAESGKHHLDDSSWLDVAERVLYSWPITLRLAMLMVVLATGTAAAAAAVGVVCQLALAGLGIRARVRRRRRVRAFQLRKALLEGPGAG